MQNQLERQISNLATSLVQLFVIFVCQAAAVATDPFFRKNFGERYLTRVRAIVGWIGWGAVSGAACHGDIRHAPLIFVIVAGVICWGYVIACLIHLRAIRLRQAAGVVWHSRCGGESLFVSENRVRDLIIAVVVTVALCFVSPFLGGFFAFSRILGYIADEIAWTKLYERYLDIRDVKIDAEFLETALRDGLPPRRTAGLFSPMPKKFTAQHRATVARIVATGAVGSDSVAPPSDEAMQYRPSRPEQIVTGILQSRRFYYVLAFGAVAFCTYRWGTPYITKLSASLRGAPTVQSTNSTTQNVVLKADVSTPEPDSSPDSFEPPPQPNINVSSENHVPHLPVSMTKGEVQVTPQIQKPPQLQDRQQDAALAEHRARRKLEIVGQMNNIITNQAVQWGQFRAECGDIITNRIRAFRFFDAKARRAFRTQGDEALGRVHEALVTAKSNLFAWHSVIERSSSLSNDALERQLKEATDGAEQMQKTRETMLAEIKAMAQNAGKK